MGTPAKRVLAAGTVTLRRNDRGATEVLLVHRPALKDWTIPKGKLEAGEYLPVCAVRETLEESSVLSELGTPVAEITYPISAGLKVVSYWIGQPKDVGTHTPTNEVDVAEWFSITKALRQATYADEREVIRKAVNLPETTPLVLLRHAKAKSRSNWAEADKDRPLDKRGRQQAQDLIPLLHAYGITRVVSSTSTRCTQTVQPFAEATELAVEGWSALSEEDAERNPQAVIELTSQLAEHAWQSDTPTLICAHRPVLPGMLKTIGIPEQSLPPGGSLIVHLGPAGAVVAVETHDPLA